MLPSAPRNTSGHRLTGVNLSFTSRAVAVVLFLMVVAACGRSAPEGAADAVADAATDPAMAGVQVVSDTPVVTPGPTTAVPTTVATVPAVAAGSYVVESGDTLSVIAERFGVTVAALSEANGITDVNTIRPGQELIIPG